MEFIIGILEALYFIFPAYCANGAPVIFGGGQKIDMGRNFIDGKPLFGKNKTYIGFFIGVLIGTFVGWAQGILSFTLDLPNTSYIVGFTLSLGAMTGDLFGSFIKRRFNIRPGNPFPIMDQINFIIFSLLFSLPFQILPLRTIFIIVLVTIPIHILVNVIAYLLKIKKDLW